MSGPAPGSPLRLVLWGDGDSPHLLKWARALSLQPALELWAASSRGFAAGFDGCVPAARRLALHTRPRAAGGNVALLRRLPALVRWLRRVRPHWVHAHYLTSHGTLAWLAQRWGGVAAPIAGSAWGSDVLLTPARSAVQRALLRRVLRACAVTTSDSHAMAARMRELGAGDVMVFPFGLESLPEPAASKDDGLWFANRALEPLYAPQRVLRQFAAAAAPHERLVVANDGSLAAALRDEARALGIAERVRFVGRLDAAAQARWYDAARWYLSLPDSDAVAVSVLEAMAHGCLPVLADLPASRELVRDGDNGLLVAGDALLPRRRLEALAARAAEIGAANREWVRAHALFAPAVEAFVARLRAGAG